MTPKPRATTALIQARIQIVRGRRREEGGSGEPNAASKESDESGGSESTGRPVVTRDKGTPGEKGGKTREDPDPPAPGLP
jgi:hypothetical protein